jgi:hypothetical protein
MTSRAGGNQRIKRILCWLFISTTLQTGLEAQESTGRPVDGIMDNSFLIEEAYNQDPGVIQHIFNALYGFEKFSGAGGRRLDFAFTQEWPAWGQAHQLSYTVPYSFIFDGSQRTDGVGDVLLNYRYQAYLDEKSLAAFAPRFSLILPTGDDKRGFGSGTVGYQWNLPFSTTLNDRWFVHANAGLTFLPRAGPAPRHDLLDFNLGASAIYCVSDSLNLMLEWVGAWNETSARFTGTRHDFASVISPGLRYAFNFPGDMQIVAGIAAPIGLTDATPDVGIFFYFSIEHRLWGKSKSAEK